MAPRVVRIFLIPLMVEKKKKQETNGEMHKRIMEEKEAKLNRGVKKAARTMVKKKEIKKLTAYFGKK